MEKTLDLVARLRTRSTPEGDCLVWQGALDQSGYGMIRVSGRTMRTHRAAYEALVGPIPVGLQLDHLCRVRACLNTDHLEPVTRAENLRRGHWPSNSFKTSCIHGHPFDEENTRIDPKSGDRCCRACSRERARSYYERDARGKAA